VFGRGVFAVLMAYEDEAFSNAVSAVRRGNLFDGFGTMLAMRGQVPAATVATDDAFRFNAATNDAEPIGFFAWLFLMIWGVVWLICAHPVYAVVFLVISLAVWALFGGAIARIAALHAAREEKISMSLALRFSAGKFFSFFAAPLIPLAPIAVIALVMGLGGLIHQC
jgi:hypothetical protein